MDILDQIVNRTRDIVAHRKHQVSLDQMMERADQTSHQTVSLVDKLSHKRPHIIAEFKRKSPSKPRINLEAKPVEVVRHYEKGGASAVSVLTEPDFFSGSLEDLHHVREVTGLPLLRKDFMVDPYQFYEARAGGADLILLIARILDKDQMGSFTALAHRLGMEVLCEIHHPDELEKIADVPVDLLGVNCRDLKRFETDIEHLIALSSALPKSIPWVAESGIRGPADVQRLAAAGYRAFLIGEYLMTGSDPAGRLREMIAP